MNWTELRKSLRAHMQKTGGLCLSETPEEILLWFHYAEYHRGYCIEFMIDDMCLLRHLAQPMKYTEIYPSLSLRDLPADAEESLNNVDVTFVFGRDEGTSTSERALWLRGSQKPGCVILGNLLGRSLGRLVINRYRPGHTQRVSRYQEAYVRCRTLQDGPVDAVCDDPEEDLEEIVQPPDWSFAVIWALRQSGGCEHSGRCDPDLVRA